MSNTRLVLISVVALGLVLLGGALYLRRDASTAPSLRQVAQGVYEVSGELHVPVSGMPTTGSDDAHLGMIEFSDYECPFCRRFVAETLPPLKDRYISTGKMRMAFANLPLSFHSHASWLAGAAICAGIQGKYWPMHDALFADQPRSRVDLAGAMLRLQLNESQFDACVSSAEPEQLIQRDGKLARNLGFSATPSFVIGSFDSKDRLKAETLIVGAQRIETFEAALAR